MTASATTTSHVAPEVGSVTAQWAGAPLRVVALIDSAEVSGPGRQLVAVARALGAMNVSLTVVSFLRRHSQRRGFLRYLEEHAIPHETIAERGPLDPAAIMRLRGLLRALRPELVQTHGYKPAALAWVLRRSGERWPWAAFFHGETHENAKVRFYNRIHGRVLRAADEVVTMTRRHLGYHRNPHQRVIYNAVLELSAQPDQEFRRRIAAVSVPSPRLLCLGRLSPEKGVDVLLHAIHLHARDGLTAGALVVGDGPERKRLEALARDLGLDGHVTFLGATADVTACYRWCQVVVIPSRSEGLPNVMLEALAHDRPVLATDVGAVAEVLADSPAGVVVPPESPEALAGAIPRAAALALDASAARVRREVAARFSLQARVDAHLTLYRDLLARTTHA